MMKLYGKYSTATTWRYMVKNIEDLAPCKQKQNQMIPKKRADSQNKNACIRLKYCMKKWATLACRRTTIHFSG